VKNIEAGSVKVDAADLAAGNTDFARTTTLVWIVGWLIFAVSPLGKIGNALATSFGMSL